MTYSLPAARFWIIAPALGLELEVAPDQRDHRYAMVVLAIDAEADPLGFARAIAWHAARRDYGLELDWRTFDEQVAYVVADEETSGVPPTPPATAGS